LGGNGGSGIVIVRYQNPLMIVSPTSLVFGIGPYFLGQSPLVLTNTVGGWSLTDNITITASPSSVYAFSTNAVDYYPSLTLTTNALGAVPSTNVYVRFAPTAVGNYDGAITYISGSVTQTVAITGSAAAQQAGLGFFATGGTITSNWIGTTNWTVHSFTNVGTTSITFTAVGNVEVLVLAGGGGGGYGKGGGGGGGAGGFVTSSVSIVGPSYPITVGAGGAGGTDLTGYYSGSDGGTSVFGWVTATGGGGGGGNDVGRPGGSGGGGGQGSYTGGVAVAGQGNNGGTGGAGSGIYAGAGGGGAGSVGVNGSSASPEKAGDGGQGITNSISGSPVGYAGGGGGGVNSGSAWGTATCGGGAGNYGVGNPGTDNKGGGGGGGGSGYASGGKGGSGIVIVRYVKRPPPTKGTLIMMR
jgi:hypothetical protein